MAIARSSLYSQIVLLYEVLYWNIEIKVNSVRSNGTIKKQRG